MKKATKKNVAILSCTALAFGAAATCVAPAFADDPTIANTEVWLQIDPTAQLSVTAPAKIPYSLDATGNFTCATELEISNQSTIPVSVKSYSVSNVNAKTTAVSKDAFDAASTTGKNAWWNTVKPNNGTAISLNSNQSSLSSEWNMAAQGQGTDTLKLTTAGGMKNIDGSIDFNTETQLSTVTWTFQTAKNK